jgi:condensin-2 complex subunit H2
MEEYDSDSEALQNRFKSLIQPIKDLASNWDIDIAEQLNDYLDELSKLTFSLEDVNLDHNDDEDSGDDDDISEDGNGMRLSQNSNQQKKKQRKALRKLNFAEAALLIQGSTHIYSKKVEYLYQLVLKSLEVLTNRKSSVLTYNNNEEGKEAGDDGDNVSVAEKRSSRNKGGIDIDLLDFTSSDPKFLLLDDYIEEGKNIDLPRPDHHHRTSSSGLDLSRSRLSLDRSVR